MSTFDIPGVGPMVSSALTLPQLNVIWQKLVQQCLGIDPATDDLANARVRIDFAGDGQPAWRINEDIAFVQVVEEPDSYNEIHNEDYDQGDDLTETASTIIYTRVHRVSIDFWGPNSWDRARQVKSCMFLDFVHDTLSTSNLYLITEFATPRRAPENYVGQWWERVYFSVRMNEQVTETMSVPTMSTLEVIIETKDGIVADIEVPLDEPSDGFSSGEYSEGEYSNT